MGATPLASFMLLSGLWEMATCRLFKIATSAGDVQTTWAASVRGPKKPIDSRYATGLSPPCAACDSFSSVFVSAR